MADIFFTSDPHFSHEGSLKWLGWDGKLQNPFATVEEKNETIIERVNARVRPQDKLYIVGDIAMKRVAIAVAKRLNGHKRIVPGNHDIYDTKYYLEVFEKIIGVKVFDDFVVTHIPLHPESVKQRWLGNVHGHTHNNQHPLFLGPRYLNVSVEANNFTPLSIDEIRQTFKRRLEMMNGGTGTAVG